LAFYLSFAKKTVQRRFLVSGVKVGNVAHEPQVERAYFKLILEFMPYNLLGIPLDYRDETDDRTKTNVMYLMSHSTYCQLFYEGTA
jgi:hypothetical protein